MKRTDTLAKYDLVLEDLLEKVQRKQLLKPSMYAIEVKVQYRFIKVLIDLGYIGTDSENRICRVNYKKQDIEEVVDKSIKRTKELNRAYLKNKNENDKGRAEVSRMHSEGKLNLQTVTDKLTDIFLLAKKYNVEDGKTKEFIKDVMNLNRVV